ncbi:RNA polymerase sigma factor [Bradyrhizobium sp. ERR14]|uniref:RNA polymerase sigma factor n=1 Tax=Bradyrhizobium sp. ERR14 TaxID=2663837 RepID=UPI001621EECC|nr:sigma-70 family RNA polymerase sigma factor [Bradyrhizobium sp. ERR14]MBB4398533.1 RNA polymerase sigma factor (sigma-70 family) [Bradyrhizobium sp. ERR14]
MNDQVLDRALAVLSSDPKDQDAWRKLFRALWPFVIAVVWRRLRDRTLAEDAAQEVFLRLVRTSPFPEISNAAQLRAYVWRVAINVSTDLLQRRRRLMRSDRALSDLHEPNLASDTPSEERIIFGEAVALTKDALGPEESELLLHFIQGRTIAETALALGQTYSNTAVQLHRLRRKLAKLLLLH